MQRLNIPEIIAFLNTQTTITDLVWNRIFWGFPKEDQVGLFIVLGEITEIQDTVEVTSRVEFRFIAPNDNSKWADIHALEHSVSDLIAQQGAVQFGTFRANKVLLNQNIFQWYDDKTRKTYIRDYTFYYFS